jgi:hypothetical protein
MVKFTRSVLVSFGALVAISATSPAIAGPKIIATNITSICQVESNGTVSSVSVALNTVTANFYGSGLHYYFIPTTSGPTVSFPSPAAAPGRFAVPAGTYNLILTTSATYPDPSASTSGFYPVTVIAPPIVTLRGGRKICAAVRAIDGVRINPIKQM